MVLRIVQDKESGLCTCIMHTQFFCKCVLKNVFVCICCACSLLLFTLITVLSVAFFCTTKSKTKGSSTNTAKKISAKKQTADTHSVGVQLIIIDKCLTFTQIFLLWTECKRKQFQSLILCYISLCCCCLNLFSFAGLASNKENNLRNSLKFLCMALHFQSQTVRSLQHLQCV